MTTFVYADKLLCLISPVWILTLSITFKCFVQIKVMNIYLSEFNKAESFLSLIFI